MSLPIACRFSSVVTALLHAGASSPPHLLITRMSPSPCYLIHCLRTFDFPTFCASSCSFCALCHSLRTLPSTPSIVVDTCHWRTTAKPLSSICFVFPCLFTSESPVVLLHNLSSLRHQKMHVFGVYILKNGTNLRVKCDALALPKEYLT